MKNIKNILSFTLMSILFICCYSNREKNLLSKMDIRINRENIYDCNQFFFTDSNLYMLFYNFHSPSSPNPFAINPFIICYNRNLECLDFGQIYTTQIILEKTDTIYVVKQEQSIRRERQQKQFNNKFVKFIMPPAQTSNICNKVVESFQLDTSTMSIYVKYREYADLTIGIRNPHFFQDSTLVYTLKDSTYNLSDFIFHSTRENKQRNNVNTQINHPHFLSGQTINEVLLFENPFILQDFYEELYKYVFVL